MPARRALSTIPWPIVPTPRTATGSAVAAIAIPSQLTANWPGHRRSGHSAAADCARRVAPTGNAKLAARITHAPRWPLPCTALATHRASTQSSASPAPPGKSRARASRSGWRRTHTRRPRQRRRSHRLLHGAAARRWRSPHPLAALAPQERVRQHPVQVRQALLVIGQPAPPRPGLLERRLHQILCSRPVTDEQPGRPQQHRARLTYEPEPLLRSRQAFPLIQVPRPVATDCAGENNPRAGSPTATSRHKQDGSV